MSGVFTIDTEADVQLVRLYTPRPIAAGLRQKAKEELDIGVIEPIEQATDWCSFLTIAPRSNGKIRLCVHLTKLNKGVKREIYPLPRIMTCYQICLEKSCSLNWMLTPVFATKIGC